MNENIYQRTEILLGKENVNLLNKKHIMICGIGGVGSYVLEAISRIGIGKITIIDKDIIDITNINRQILATIDSVGKEKVVVAKERVHSINDAINLNAINQKITLENIDEIFEKDKVDYVVDCVDDFNAKIAIIKKCDTEKIKCISCMGMGNKIEPLKIKVDDIYKTNTCPLARNIRKKLKELGIKKQKVIYSTEIPKSITAEEKIKYGNVLGSVSFVPSVAGLVMASEIVKDLLKN